MSHNTYDLDEEIAQVQQAYIDGRIEVEQLEKILDWLIVQGGEYVGESWLTNP